jgi:hypothetical protein
MFMHVPAKHVAPTWQSRAVRHCTQECFRPSQRGVGASQSPSSTQATQLPESLSQRAAPAGQSAS